jgi:protein-tyrosine phosphatase
MTMTPVSAWRRTYHRWSTHLYGPSRHVSTLSWLGEERIAVGCLPTAATLYRLPQHGVTHIVNCRSVAQTWLSQDLALELQLLGSARVAHAPMWDFGRPQPPQLWSMAAVFAAEALAADPTSRVLIHCQQGRRRSVLVAYAVLRLRGHAGEQAQALITRHRLEAELVDAYVGSVERWLTSRL